MENFPESLAIKIEERQKANAFRMLAVTGNKIDFSSNDYLGFSSNAQIFSKVHNYLTENGFMQNGSTGSRLLSGNHALYPIVEKFIAGFHNAKSALIFNSGYDANVGFFSSVPQKGDIVLYDEYIHASIRDGLRLSGAASYKFAHNDLDILEKLIERHKGNREIYIVTESVFSMDGDSPDLPGLARLAGRYACRLVIDEAHALGVFGPAGEGLVQQLGLEDKIFARVMTFGKGLGCHGAALLGPEPLRDYLVNFARSLIYTTALPPHSLATILFAYRELENTACREGLGHNIQYFRAELQRLSLGELFIDSVSAIQCAVIPGNEKARQTAAYLQANGYSVKPILSPTVPSGSERLRFCLHSYNTAAEVTSLLEALCEVIL
ncbi:8-amino-7-oxononanoate synthase [uncultured Flavobacterium sp.]|uniref:aminotransferase class I/II-fold pyridoxal phosphate-dependent enzyme n=1 Tax=uncultured Flavobacterium sp. TaxID=165435 RepID=UPI0025D3300B|nr:8-amino-7-oxononanoate synthase [uncultured Flavobacterium sp.]